MENPVKRVQGESWLVAAVAELPAETRIALGASLDAGTAAKLAVALEESFTGGDLQQLHAAASAAADAAAGKGPLAFRAVHGDAWAKLTLALGIAAERTRFPLRTFITDDVDPPTSAFQVFVQGDTTPLTVTVKNDDGTGAYDSTVVPAGGGFEIAREQVEAAITRAGLALGENMTWPPTLVLRPTRFAAGGPIPTTTEEQP